MTTRDQDIVVTDKWRIACDGGEGALGHPRVWIQIPHDTGEAVCGYCDRKFVHQDKFD